MAALTDSQGNVVERYRYDAYGDMTVEDVDGDGTLTGNPYGFTGRRYDAETGLWYYRTRYYSDAYGRFINRNPWQPNMRGIAPAPYFPNYLASGGLGSYWQGRYNLYDYAGSDPANYMEPFSERWHHLIPQLSNRTQKRLTDLGIDYDIHSPENGWELTTADHDELHRRGWHKEWRDILEGPGSENLDRQQLLDLLDQMKNDPKYKEILDKGHPARCRYGPEWRKRLKNLRDVAEKISKVAVPAVIVMQVYDKIDLLSNDQAAAELAEHLANLATSDNPDHELYNISATLQKHGLIDNTQVVPVHNALRRAVYTRPE